MASIPLPISQHSNGAVGKQKAEVHWPPRPKGGQQSGKTGFLSFINLVLVSRVQY